MEVQTVLRATDTETVKRRLAFQKSFSQEVRCSTHVAHNSIHLQPGIVVNLRSSIIVILL